MRDGNGNRNAYYQETLGISFSKQKMDMLGRPLKKMSGLSLSDSIYYITEFHIIQTYVLQK